MTIAALMNNLVSSYKTIVGGNQAVSTTEKHSNKYSILNFTRI